MLSMIKRFKALGAALFLVLFTGVIFAQDIEIRPGQPELTVGDSLQFSIVYLDSGDTETDTAGTWSIHPQYLGTISEAGMFYAELPGECIVRAELDSLTAWVPVLISGEAEDDTSEYAYNGLALVPSDTVISIGSQIQYTAHYRAENGEPGAIVDSALSWSLEGMPVGELSQDGLLTATSAGYALVYAALDDRETSAFVVVADSSTDTTGLNHITITRDSPNPMGYSVMQELTEGEIWTLGGLPFPMNVLNGGSIYFPVGSLSEDIRIHIGLPLFAEVRGDSIGWNGKGVLGGVDFTVMVNDTVSEPYYFETPLIVGLVYKRGLIDKMNIDPHSLALYFAVQDGDSLAFDTTGITNTTVDLYSNRIYSGIVHFSSLAIMGESISTDIADEQLTIPHGYTLEQNYPNPFNPVTTFSYTLPKADNVTISIFDMSGRKIATLVNDHQQAGTYSLTWDASHHSSGIYFYRLTANDLTITRKMVFMK